MKDIKIIVATHKKYIMPTDKIYLPIYLGSKGKEDIGYLRDDIGQNISHKNPYFCELTGVYWAWKNLTCDYIGLVHYRRYFSLAGYLKKILWTRKKLDLILSTQEISMLLDTNDILLPRKRNYIIETIWSHYKHAHNIYDLQQARNVIEEVYPEYLQPFERVMKGTRLYLFNMFVMKKKHFDEYCEWLFNILFTLENRIDVKEYDQYQSRVFGFISERLFNVWLEYHSNLKKKELSVVNIEGINWLKKGEKFIIRKLTKS